MPSGPSSNRNGPPGITAGRAISGGRLSALFAALFLLLAVGGVWGQVFISEFMASGSALEDEDGDTPDWIELWNVGPAPANLAGWHLTDHAANLTKWTFPSTNIPPGGFLVVFASGKDRSIVVRAIPTTFAQTRPRCRAAS